MNRAELKKWMVESLLPNVDADNRPTTACSRCGERLHIGDSIQVDSNTDPYCKNWECVSGIATESTCLEHCWWGEEEDFWSLWDEVLEDKINLIKKEVKEIINAKNKQS